MLPVRDVLTRRQRLPDGVELATDIWQPAAPGRYPVLLMRQPYGRRIASTLVYAHPAWYAAQGYIVAIQDVRGAGNSGGDFRLFADDGGDGAAAVSWAAGLPGATGRVGMYGFSYQGTNQLLAWAAGAPVAALAPAMAGWTVRTDWAWENGAFCLAANIGWAAQMGALQAQRRGDTDAFDALKTAAGGVLGLDRPAWPEALERYAHLTHYRDWIERPGPDRYWDTIAPAFACAKPLPRCPMLHVGGWYDLMLEGTLGAHAALADADHRLLVGPWTHVPWGRVVGAYDLGPAAASPVDRMQVAFFDRHLKGHDVDVGPPARLFDLLGQQWRDAFPPGEGLEDGGKTPVLFLASDGLAAIDPASGRLLPDPPPQGVDRIVHDPWRAAPSLGGHAAPAAGMRDRAAVDCRADVLTYSTGPLPAPLLLSGRVALELHVETDARGFDIDAVLSAVRPDGVVLNLTQGHASVAASAARPLTLPMRATCATLPAGFALRLSVAAASFPAYPVNPGNGRPPVDGRAIEQLPATLAVLTGGEASSALRIARRFR